MKLHIGLGVLAAKAVLGNQFGYGYGGYENYNQIKTVTKVIEVTYTSDCPVTETITIGGNVVTTTYTTTNTIVTYQPTTFISTEILPDVTRIESDVEYTTITSLCAVRQTSVVGGSTVTHTYTTLSTIVTVAPTVILETEYGPDVTEITQQVQYTTMTSLCGVTETTVIEGETHTVTYTTVSTIVTKVPTVIMETEHAPDVTQIQSDVLYTTITSLCPVTETTVIDGSTRTLTSLETITVITFAPTQVVETEYGPDVTKIEENISYTTLTSLCPVTETKVVEGETITVTFIRTSTIVTAVESEVVETVYEPDVTLTESTVRWITITTLCPVTETETVEGETFTYTYTETSTYVTTVPSTIVKTEVNPDVTETAKAVSYTTMTSLYPVTETRVVDGQTRTVTYTETSTIITPVPTVIIQTEVGPDVTKTAKAVSYTTMTSLYPVTETRVVDGQTRTVTYTETSTIITPVPTVIIQTEVGPDVTDYEDEIVYLTVTSRYPVTRVTVIDGETETLTYTQTLTDVEALPTYIVKTSWEPDITVTDNDVEYTTITSLYPVTKTLVVEGETEIITLTNTVTIITAYPTVITKTEVEPDVIITENELAYATVTTRYPVTETTVIGGNTIEVTHTVTSTIVTAIPSVITETHRGPDVTEVESDIDYITITELIPVTETLVVNGETQTVVYEITETIVTQASVTVTHVQTRPDVTLTRSSLQIVTATEKSTVTETQVVNGETHVVTYVETGTVVTFAPITITETQKGADVTRTQSDLVLSTFTSFCPVTEIVVVAGTTHTVTFTQTMIVTEHVELYSTRVVSQDVYTTVTHPVTVVTTVIEGYPVYITHTGTQTITIPYPTTIVDHVPGVTITSSRGAVVTGYGPIEHITSRGEDTTVVVPGASTSRASPLIVTGGAPAPTSVARAAFALAGALGAAVLW